jgi:hypothetical protein
VEDSTAGEPAIADFPHLHAARIAAELLHLAVVLASDRRIPEEVLVEVVLEAHDLVRSIGTPARISTSLDL